MCHCKVSIADTGSLQGLHSVAYSGGLGRPLIAPPGAASRLTGDDLAHFVSEHFTGTSMALAGVFLILSAAVSSNDIELRLHS